MWVYICLPLIGIHSAERGRHRCHLVLENRSTQSLIRDKSSSAWFIFAINVGRSTKYRYREVLLLTVVIFAGWRCAVLLAV